MTFFRRSLFVVGVLLLAQAVTMAQTRRAIDRASTPNPHRHQLDEDFLSQLKPEIEIIPSTASVDGLKENLITNKTRTFRFFTITSTEGFEHIFFEDLRAHETYEIVGVAWPGRPLNDPVCVGDYLIFDRSVNPNRSMHYAFNLRKRVVTVARAF
jgi:hypothetical protein